MSDAFAALRSAQVFRPLSDYQLEALAEQSDVRRHGRGERLWSRGDVLRRLAVVASGRLECGMGDTTRGWVRAIVGAGEACCVGAAIDDGPQICTVKALEGTTVVHVPSDAIQSLMAEDAAFAVHFAQLVSADLRQAVTSCGRIALLTPLQRLAGYLVELSDGGARARLSDSQERIAAQLGTVREVVGRALRKLETDGLIARRGRRIEILRRDELRALAH